MSLSRWEAAREYILSSGMPKVPDEIAKDLDAPITVEEFLGALKSFKSGKAPALTGILCLTVRLFLINWHRVL